MKKAFVLPLSLAIACFTLCVDGVCAEKYPVPEAKAKEQVQQAAQKKMTKQETLASIDEIFKNHPDILSLMGGMQANRESGGAVTYTYQGKKLDELDEETLSNILGMARQQISLENIKRMEQQQRQMRAMRQIENLNKQQRALRQSMPNVSGAPKTYAPLKTYNAPKTYSPPKTYTAPKNYNPPKIPKMYR